MEPAETIKACLARGMLISGEELKLIEAGLSIDELAASRQLQARPAEEEKTGRITYRVRRVKSGGTVTPSDVLEQHKNMYEAIKGMLLSKTSALSISNARDGAASVSLIGMVKQATEGGFILEDVTGEIEVVCEGGRAVEAGDVVGVRGPVKNGRMQCRDIVYPDVPLLRPIGRIDAAMLIVPAAAKPAAGADVVLSTGAVETDAKNIIVDSSPAHLSIYKDGKISVLFYATENETGPQEAINMLKRRLLRQPAGLSPDSGAFLIEPVPDVFWILGKGREWMETYKGVTIVHTPRNPEKQALIDLRTREARFL